MLKTNYIIPLSILAITLTLCGCNTTHSVKSVDNTEISRTVNLDNKEHYKDELLTLIKTGETSSICKNNFKINTDDVVDNAELKQYYFFNGSIYLQINDMYMFRFQLDTTDNLIESYIKYNLEA